MGIVTIDLVRYPNFSSNDRLNVNRSLGPRAYASSKLIASPDTAAAPAMDDASSGTVNSLNGRPGSVWFCESLKRSTGSPVSRPSTRYSEPASATDKRRACSRIIASSVGRSRSVDRATPMRESSWISPARAAAAAAWRSAATSDAAWRTAPCSAVRACAVGASSAKNPQSSSPGRSAPGSSAPAAPMPSSAARSASARTALMSRASAAWSNTTTGRSVSIAPASGNWSRRSTSNPGSAPRVGRAGTVWPAETMSSGVEFTAWGQTRTPAPAEGRRRRSNVRARPVARYRPTSACPVRPAPSRTAGTCRATS